MCNGVWCVKKQGKTKRKRFRFGDSFWFLLWGVNKSHGQTFQKVGIYLPSPVFAHGQLYVALSRARVGDPTNITIMITHPPLHGQLPPPRDPGQSYFGAHNVIEVCVAMPVANTYFGDQI
jgi:hypothetical protein